MTPPLRWPPRRIAVAGALWALAVLLVALARMHPVFSYQVAPPDYRIWSAFVLVPPLWVYCVAFLPPVAALLYFAVRR